MALQKLMGVSRSLVEKFPQLHAPAHFVFTTGLKTKNVLLHSMMKHAGYQPKGLSDRGQDRWVIELFGGKRNGYFLDLGGADGFSESNTYVLEKQFGWRGLCIEPNPVLFNLMTKRYGRTCTCISEVIDQEQGEIEYAMHGQESGIIASETDNNDRTRKASIDSMREKGQIKTIRSKTLAGVLEENGAPSVIDYFSFDVEGAETRILRTFPFDRYTFLALTIERPTPELNELLFRNGYHFVRNSLYDSFYVHRTIPNFDSIDRDPFEQIPPKPF